MRHIDMEGICHIYRNNCEESLVIVVRLMLKEKVDYKSMQKALIKAADRYPNFHSVIASRGTGLFYEDNEEKPVLMTEDKPYRLGSKELNYYPYSVCALDRQLKITAHHGLTDGYGMMEFIKTLLYYYYTELGIRIEDADMIRTNEKPYDIDSETEDSLLKYWDKDFVPKQPELGDTPLFSIPTVYWDDNGDYVYKRYKIRMSVSQIIDMAKSTSSSVTGVLNAIINKAYQNTYELDGKVLISAITSNFRRIYPSDSLHNFSGWFLTFYPPAMHGMSLDELSPVMKRLIDANNSKENVMKVTAERCIAGTEISENSISKIFEPKDEVLKQKVASRNSVGYLITNVGPFTFPKEIEDMIDDCELYFPAKTVPVVFGVNSIKDALVLSVNMSFDGDSLVKGICKVCKENNIDVTCQDMGIEETDKLCEDGIRMREKKPSTNV